MACGADRAGSKGSSGSDALAQACRRVGAAPLRWLFDLLRGPAAVIPRQPGARWRGLLVCAIDGTTLTVPHSRAMGARFTRQAGNHGGTGYPQVRLVALVACGTRTLLDAVFGPTTCGETTYAPRLLASLRPGMILLADRNFGAARLLAGIAATRADFLVRLKNGRTLPVLARHRDGSYTSALGGLRVRVIEAEITITTTTGSRRTGVYRLATTLLDHHAHPAGDLIRFSRDAADPRPDPHVFLGGDACRSLRSARRKQRGAAVTERAFWHRSPSSVLSHSLCMGRRPQKTRTPSMCAGPGGPPARRRSSWVGRIAGCAQSAPHALRLRGG